MNIYAVALLLAILFSTCGQLFLKKGALLITNTNLIHTILLNFSLIAGITLYGISTVLYVFSLRKLDLAVAYPTNSLSYIFLLFVSYLTFGESITFYKLLGILMILIGIILLWR